MKKSRFVDNCNGTVTDKFTKLIWLKNANAFGSSTWEQAVSDANDLASGLAGLADGSKAGDWRLPSIKELQSLVDFTYINPALSNASGTGRWTEGSAFVDVQAFYYWSATPYVDEMEYAWLIYMYSGNVTSDNKAGVGYVWPVRKDGV